MDVSLMNKPTVKNLVRSVDAIIKENPNLARNISVQLPIKTIHTSDEAPKKYGKAFSLAELKNNLFDKGDGEIGVKNEEEFGSDSVEVFLGLDLSRGIRIGTFDTEGRDRKTQLQGACNTKVACDREFKTEKREFTIKCHQPYSNKGRCFYMALKHLGLSTDVCVKD